MTKKSKKKPESEKGIQFTFRHSPINHVRIFDGNIYIEES